MSTMLVLMGLITTNCNSNVMSNMLYLTAQEKKKFRQFKNQYYKNSDKYNNKYNNMNEYKALMSSNTNKTPNFNNFNIVKERKR